MPATAAYHWDLFELRPAARLLRRDGADVALEPKAFDVLVYLIQHRDRVVSKEELLEQLWPGRVVGDATVNQCLLKIRQAIDDGQDESVIQTVRRRGFRFQVEVRQEDLAQGSEFSSAIGLLPGLLVLPFRNLSPVQADVYVAENMTELLIAGLAATKGLHVISRTSAMALGQLNQTLPEVAARVSAQWVVEGSVRVSGERIQVVAQLIDARTDSHIWAETYSHDLTELLDLQQDLARQIARCVHGNLPAGPASPGLSVDQLRLYLRGRSLFNRRSVEDLQQARQAFATVTESGPDFPPAWASLGETLVLLAHYGGMPVADAWPAAADSVGHALSLDARHPIALACQGALRFFFERDLSGAEQSTLQALAGQPNYDLALMTMANICSVQKRFDDARQWCEQALQMDPLNIGLNMNFGDHLILMGHPDQAVEQFERTLALAPEHLPSRLRCAWAMALAQRTDDASQLMENVRAEHAGACSFQEFAAMISGLLGDHAGSRDMFVQLQANATKGSAWALARAAAGAGMKDKAFELRAQAIKQRSSSIPFLRVTPAFVSLHDDSRWPPLLAEAGLD